MTVPRAKAAAVWAHVERTRMIDKTIGRWVDAVGAERAA
jgi:hypothetical protein